MAKFCGKCGFELDEATGLCPNCDTVKVEGSFVQEEPIEIPDPKQEVVQASEEPLSKKDEKKKRKADKKAAKKAKKKEKRMKLTTGQKVHRFFLKLLLYLVLLVVLAGGLIGGLFYLGVLNIPFLSDFNKENLIKVVNEKTIVIKEMNIVMETKTEGSATVIVQMPDYKLLFKEAYSSENPEQYLLNALELGKYEVQEFEEIATVTVEHGVTTVHSDEVVHQLLEESLINAINALSEVER